MSGLYSTYSISNTSETFAERARAIAAEKAAFGDSVLEKVYYGKSFNGPEADVYVCKDGSDDGKISFGEKLKNFGKGIVAPIKNIFASPKNMLITGLTVAAGAALIAVTGGAAAPVMVALGLVGGATQVGVGLYKQATATTDAQAAQAWQQMGSGTLAVGTSALGAKSALKAAGVKNASNMSTWGAIVKCVKDAPKFFSNAVKTASSKFSTIFPNWKGASPEPPRKQPVYNNSNNNDVIELPAPKRNALPGSERKALPGSNRLALPCPDVPSTPKTETLALPSGEKRLALPSGERLGLPAPKTQVHNVPDVIELPPASETPVSVVETTSSASSGSKIPPVKSWLSALWQKIKESMDLFGLNNK